jgi:hypothetical protein
MSTRRIESFLLRLVVDERPGADAQAWCGRIQHVASGSERHFACLQEMLAFIGEQFTPSHTQIGEFEGTKPPQE